MPISSKLHLARRARRLQITGKITAPDEGLGALQLPLAQLCCVNADCADVGKQNKGNLSVRTGKGGGRWRVLRCSTCRTEFSERKGTALFNTTMEPSRIEAVAACPKEGRGIRKTARLTGASKCGVTAIAMRLGLHAKVVHDQRVRDLSIKEAQLDEKWPFVGCKQKNCDPLDPADDAPITGDRGDQWDHTALDVDSRMVVSLVVGKLTQDNLEKIVADFAARSGGSPPS